MKKQLKKLATFSLIAFSGITSVDARPQSKDPLAQTLMQVSQEKKLIGTAKKYLGTRYKYGANTRRAVDCSSFVQQVFKKHKKRLPRTSKMQSKVGKRIQKKDLQKGDLVFFSTRGSRQVGHVGIYIGGGNFIHASSAKKKVVITKLSTKYYKRHYKGARRIS